MRLSNILASLLLTATAAIGNPVSPRQTASTPAAPVLTPLLSATIGVTSTSFKPIPVFGNVRLIEPVTGGNITGAINATVSGGFAYPPAVANETIELVEFGIYGTTTDGYDFYVSANGVGPILGPLQYARLVSSSRRLRPERHIDEVCVPLLDDRLTPCIGS